MRTMRMLGSEQEKGKDVNEGFLFGDVGKGGSEGGGLTCFFGCIYFFFEQLYFNLPLA